MGKLEAERKEEKKCVRTLLFKARRRIVITPPLGFFQNEQASNIEFFYSLYFVIYLFLQIDIDS